MNLGKAIFSILNTDTDVEAIVGNRIFPNIVSQEEMDVAAIVYRIDDTDPTNTKDGASTLDTLRFYVWTMAEGYDECRELSEKVRLALDRKAGTFAGVVVDSIVFDGGDDDGYDEDLKKDFVSNIYKARVRR